MDRRDLALWQAFLSIEPQGAQRDDLRAAVNTSMISASMTGHALPDEAFEHLTSYCDPQEKVAGPEQARQLIAAQLARK